MSVKDNADVKPTTTKDEEVISLKENVHSKTVENAETPGLSDEEEDPHVSFKTWVVVWILSCGYGLSFWPIPVMANIGGLVAAELDAPEKAYWFIPAWTISITVCFMLCGANTDLLGRRWFLVLGNLVSATTTPSPPSPRVARLYLQAHTDRLPQVCTVGHIVTASKASANAVIAGMAIAGFGGGNCQASEVK
ncbi:uncharacterized protein PV06_07515 [Exophiala oligosperma]|uniref:Major facilitator superfamily (MFS) profile domain-containing protein n=1 Tax=Exophiala oligosperma TaxID=215243 RepID=A0A0D2DB25_9EURO|nr:uncharacterized protein PV06_07515 [Exophiala oligosperma]KIW40308.1 hypothetical protein PV06_07515 [Exophiala oligosperma]